MQTRVVQSESPADYIPNLSALAQQGYNLVIGVGFTEIDAMKAVAKQFPKTHFAIVDVSNADEGGRRTSRASSSRSRRPATSQATRRGSPRRRGGKAVSSVGGQKQPPVDRYIAGFQAGAKAAVPGVKTLNGYSQDFENQANARRSR